MATWYHKFFHDYQPIFPETDLPVNIHDFQVAGQELELRKEKIHMIWNGITRNHAPAILKKQTLGHELTRREQLFANTITSEERAMYISPEELSFKGLEMNFVSGYLSEMRNIGLISLQATRIVLENVANERLT